jgi:hypothetical protein
MSESGSEFRLQAIGSRVNAELQTRRAFKSGHDRGPGRRRKQKGPGFPQKHPVPKPSNNRNYDRRFRTSLDPASHRPPAIQRLNEPGSGTGVSDSVKLKEVAPEKMIW